MKRTSDKRLALAEHLEEFRARIIKSLIFILAVSGLVYSFVGELIPLLARPVGKLVFIAPQEAFVANLKLAFLGGLFLSSPFLLYQVWAFVSVGLKPRERKYVSIFGPLSFIFFILGASFGYFIIVPIGVKFLLGFSSGYVSPMITISKYISFVGNLTIAFGIVFELPLASLFLTKLGVVTPQFLSKRRRHAVLIIFILAAMLTPPDVITQCLMALPLIALYELGIVFSKLVCR